MHRLMQTLGLFPISEKTQLMDIFIWLESIAQD
jgi:hypothetical protein